MCLLILVLIVRVVSLASRSNFRTLLVFPSLVPLLILYTLMFGVLLLLPLRVVISTMLYLLMITLDIHGSTL